MAWKVSLTLYERESQYPYPTGTPSQLSKPKMYMSDIYFFGELKKVTPTVFTQKTPQALANTVN